MTRTDAQAIGEGLEAFAIQYPLFDEPQRALDSGTASLPSRAERSGLRATPEARAKSRLFGGGSGRIETDILALWHAGFADRPAIDAGGLHRDEEPAVKRLVSPLHRRFACLWVEHGVKIARFPAGRESGFGDHVRIRPLCLKALIGEVRSVCCEALE